MLSDAFGSQRSPWDVLRQMMPQALGDQSPPGNQGAFGGQIPDIRSMFGNQPQPGGPGEMFRQMLHQSILGNQPAPSPQPGQLNPSQIPQALQQFRMANPPQAPQARQPFGASPNPLLGRMGMNRPTGY